MIEDDFLADDLELANPVGAIRQVSHDPTLRQTVALRSGRRATAVEIQAALFERATAFCEQRGLASVGDDVGGQILGWWERTIDGLSTDPMTLADTVDWVAKQRIVSAFADRHRLAPTDARLKAIDLQYHDMRPERSLARRAGLRRLVEAAAVDRAMIAPPTDTRAWFRGACLARWPGQVTAANWDSIVFDLGRDPLRRVPMPEPLRGTEDLVGGLIADSATPAELLAKLAGGT